MSIKVNNIKELKNVLKKILKDDVIYLCDKLKCKDLKRKIKYYNFSYDELKKIYISLDILVKNAENERVVISK